MRRPARSRSMLPLAASVRPAAAASTECPTVIFAWESHSRAHLLSWYKAGSSPRTITAPSASAEASQLSMAQRPAPPAWQSRSFEPSHVRIDASLARQMLDFKGETTPTEATTRAPDRHASALGSDCPIYGMICVTSRAPPG